MSVYLLVGAAGAAVASELASCCGVVSVAGSGSIGVIVTGIVCVALLSVYTSVLFLIVMSYTLDAAQPIFVMRKFRNKW